jgi:hypothetical protein
MKFLRDLPLAFKVWIIIIFLSSTFCLLAYSVTQQALRHLADDPQQQIAEDAAAALAVGATPASLIPSSTIDIGQSLAPFAIVFDQSGDPIVGSGKLNGIIPVPPKGVFVSASQSGEDRITWQPEPGVRIAAIIVPYAASSGSGFVLAGRSLREIELYENQTFLIAAATWLLSVVFGGILSWLFFSSKG